jgi:hypothetical protein
MAKIDTILNLKSVKLESDFSKVHVKWTETIILEPAPGEDANREYRIPHQASPPIRPHKDLIDSLKKLRKFALAHLDISLKDESKDIKEFNVLSLNVNGSIDLKQARVKIGLVKKVDRINDIVDMPKPEFLLYPSDEEKAKYLDADKVAAIVEDIQEEVWSYLFSGKFDESLPESKQLFLFRKTELEEA